MPDDNDTPTTSTGQVDGPVDGQADGPQEGGSAPVIKVTTRRSTRKTAVKRSDAEAAPEVPEAALPDEGAPVAKKAAAKKATTKKAAAKKTTTKKAAAKKTAAADADQAQAPAETSTEAPADAPSGDQAPAVTTTVTTRSASSAKKTTKKAAAKKSGSADESSTAAGDDVVPGVVFQAPDPTTSEDETGAGPRKRTRKSPAGRSSSESGSDSGSGAEADSGNETGHGLGETSGDSSTDSAGNDGNDGNDENEDSGEGGGRRRRRRGGRRRRKSSDGSGDDSADNSGDNSADHAGDRESGDAQDSGGSDGAQDGSADDDGSGEGGTRRRRRRRRSGDGEGGDNGDSGGSGGSGRSRKGRSGSGDDQITALAGSTRLEAKKQRRREGREAGRRRAPIVSEAEFLTRRESVERVMVVRQRDELTQIGVLEDKVLVEHYVSRESQTSLIGNIYLGRVQNVLPSMEAAFIDIGRGRNAVLYAGEVNWSALGHKDGQARKIESVLSSGQTVLVQVTKDPIGQKGARLTSQISLAGRFLVYVPDGTTSGISRKLPDTERTRLKALLKEMVPDTAGVIVRTAAEGASEDELVRDVERLTARFADIEKKTKGSAPQLLYGEPDLTVKVVRDLFTEDFATLVVQGDDAWDTIQGYVSHVAADLEERLERYDPADHNGVDLFAAYRVEEQIAKALDRKVWLPSGGSLVIDRTEAMTVVDVNTGKFTGSGGNLEETVTKNNLEAAEEVVRQLRLRDIGGIIVVDFIDMVLESNRDLVLRRLVECLGRDRTRHQVAEVTSLGLVQMTRKRIGTGLVEAFSQPCEHCAGRGLVIHDHPVDSGRPDDDAKRGGGRRSRGGRGGNDDHQSGQSGNGQSGNGQSGKGQSGKGQSAKDDAASSRPSPKEFAAMARHHGDDDAVEASADETSTDTSSEAPTDEVAATLVDATVAEEVRTDAEVEVGTDLETAAVAEAITEAVAETGIETGVETGIETDAEQTTATLAPVGDRPAVQPVVEPAADQVAAEPEAPKVITRSRRRSASRPAGPPVAEADGGAGSGSAAEPDADGALVDADAVDPVPVKRRGFRRR